MIRTYATPLAFKAAVEQRLRNEIAWTGMELPRRRQLLPLEAHVAEKLHAYTLHRPRPNSRVKDMPDLALLASMRPLEAPELRAAIDFVFEHRATHPAPTELPDPPKAWGPVYARMADVDGLAWKNLGELVEAVRRFLDPVLAGDRGRWDPAGWTWR